MRSALIAMGLFVSLSSSANAGETFYTTHIKPVFDRQCAGCHGGDAPELAVFEKASEAYIKESKGPKMDSYPHLLQFVGWPDSGAVMRRLDDGKNTKDARPGNMYQQLGATEEERQKNLRLFKDWIGNWTLKRFPDLTKEDLAGIKAKY